MTTPRLYKATLSTPDAIAELRRCTGTQFDPQVTAAFEFALADESRDRLQGARRRHALLDPTSEARASSR